MVNLIKRSIAIDYINKFGAPRSCVDRFYRDTVRLENQDDEMIRAVMRKVVNSSIPYLPGRLFVVGSLKEFDELGVGAEIFNEINLSKTKVEPPAVMELKKIIKKTPRITKDAIKEVINVKPIKKKVIIPRESALKKATKELINSKVNLVALDMEHFRADYIFSNVMLTKLHGPLEIFQKRESLNEMKDFDSLGKKIAPMRLLFIKYLIDNNYHQGLYNVQAVLGKGFFVKNDLEKNDKKLYRMSIANDETTNYKWQLYLIRN